jgi:hypothetical protein
MIDYAIYGLIALLFYVFVLSQSKIETIMLFFISLYIIIFAVAFLLDIRLSIFLENDTDDNILILISLLYLFFAGYIFQRFLRSKNIKIYKIYKIKHLTYIYDFLIISLLLLELYLTDFGILKATYGNDTKDSYFLDFINILFALYIYNDKKYNNRIYIYMFIHIFLAFADGERLMAITTILILLMLYINRIPKLLIPIMIVAGYLFVESISMLRSGHSLFDMSSIWASGTHMTNHHGDVLYASLSIIEFSKNLPISDKLLLSSQYTLAFFFSKLWLPDNLIFSEVVKESVRHSGGGMLIAFFYAFFGAVGAFVAGYFIAFSLSWGRYYDLKLVTPPYAYLLIAFLPRNFAYSPIHIFKTILFVFLFYIFIKFILFQKEKHELV